MSAIVAVVKIGNETPESSCLTAKDLVPDNLRPNRNGMRFLPRIVATV